MDNKYSLTFPQHNIWLVNSMYNSSKFNFIVGVININKDLNVEYCKSAINNMFKNNDAMRISIVVDGGIPYQVINEYHYREVECVDLTFLSKDEVEKYINEYKEKEIDILKDNLVEFKILKYKDGRGAVLLKMHHIVSDAWSFSKIIEQFLKNYEELQDNKEIIDTDYPSYTSYINSCLEYKESDKYLKDESFWQEYLNGYTQNIGIKDKTKNITNISSRYNIKLEKNLNDEIMSYCKENKISPYVMFLTALATYIYRIKEKDDFVIGTPSLNRSNFKEKQTIGMFVSTLPLRIKIKEGISFLELAKSISSNTMSLFRHQKYPYIDILKDVRSTNNINEKLYSITLSYQNARATYSDKEKYDTKWYKNDYQIEDLQIHILDMDSTGILEINYDYLSELFDEKEIMLLHSRLISVIKNAILDKNVDVESIDIISKEEKSMLESFNNTFDPVDFDKSVIDIFQETALKFASKEALVFEGKSLSYKELNEKANSVAHYLVNEKKIKEGDIVGIKIRRSIDLIIAILAVSKTRAAYLPIDPTFPEDRINYIINDSKAKIVLDDISDVNYTKKEDLKIPFSEQSPFYVLYTSGSTGNPKGVVITNKNITNFVHGINKEINVRQEDNVLSITTVSFDIFELELWVPLLNGAKIVLANDKEKLNPYLLNKLCKKNNVNIMQTTTSIYSSLIYDKNNQDMFCNMTKILIGGEKVTSNVIKKLKQITTAKIFNVYGPTETTIWSSVGAIDDANDINVGKPISNTKMHILDKKRRELPIGIPGELHISGEGVAKGYLNNEELTNKAFFSDNLNRYYATGDLAYIDFNLKLKILDRIDLQVKINGRRIEIEEIEKVIYNTGLVKNVVVILKNNKLVCVYRGKIDDIEKLKNEISKVLPYYMIPNSFYELETFPMTENKKVDRKRIKMLDFDVENKVITLPQSEIQIYLSKKISSYLKLNKDIDINENLYELGIDSLNIMKLVNDINDDYGVIILSNEILTNPCIRTIEKTMLNSMDNCANNLTDKLRTQSKVKEVLLTSTQKSIHTESLKDKNSLLYNLPFEITIDEKIDLERLKESIKVSVNNHEILFSKIVEKGNEIYYVIKKDNNFEPYFEIVDIKKYEIIKKEFVKPFNFHTGPLFRIKMYQVENEIKLLFDFSHLIVDGYSVNILLNDISDCYNKGSIRKEKLSFDKCINLRSVYEEDKAFFFNRFGIDKESDIKIENTRLKKEKSTNNKKGSKVFFEFDKTKVEEYCKKNNITINNLVFGIFNIVLSYITKKSDVVIGLTSIGRNLNFDSNTIGMFANVVPFRVNVNKNLQFNEFLNYLKEEMVEYVRHQNYNYFEFLKDINDIYRVPNFIHIIYSFQSDKMPRLKIKNTSYKIKELPTYTSKYDFTYEVCVNENTLSYNIEYNFGHSKDTVSKLLNMLYQVTKYVISSNTNDINDIMNFMTDKLFLYELNSNTTNEIILQQEISDENYKYIDEKETEILNVYKEILGSDKITTTDDFFENGGDSLLAMNLISKLNNIGISVTYSDLFKYKTVEDLYKHIFYYENKYFIDKNVSNYDYTRIEELLKIKKDVNNLVKKDIKNVLLIGPTGFLGMHILNKLYEKNVKKIYCVIRQKDGISAEKRFYDLLEFYFGKDKVNAILERVVLVKADVTISNSIENAMSLYELKEIDLVINCAARVKHYGEEIKFMAINVDAVSNLINLCISNNIKLAHISTLSVSGDFIGGGQKIPNVDHIDFDESSFYINQNLDNIYAYTKFISEKMIYDAIINKGLDATVFRVGNLTGRYSDGKFQKNIADNAFVNRIGTLLSLKVIPESSLDLHIEMTPVDYAAKAILDICYTQTKNTVYHIFNDNYIPMEEMLSLLKKINLDIDVVNEEKIKDIISSNLKENPNLVNGIIMDINDENSISYHTNIIPKSDFTKEVLKKIGFTWPKIDNEYFYNFLEYLKKYGKFS